MGSTITERGKEMKAYGKVTPDTMLSCSRLAAVAGRSRYSTPNDELRKTIDALQLVEPEPFESEAADWGNRLEQIVLREAALRLGIEKLNLDHPKPYFHSSWQLCGSLDGNAMGTGHFIKHDPANGIFVVSGKGEIKLDGVGVMEAKVAGCSPEDTLPLYRGPLQLQGQMSILDAKWGCVAVLYQGIAMRLFLFEPHQESLLFIEHLCHDFQRRVDHWKKTNEILWYEPQHTDDAAKCWPVADDGDEPIVLQNEAVTWAAEVVEAKKIIKEKEEIIENRQTKLMALMQGKSKAVAGSYKVSWPMRHYKAQEKRIIPARDAYSIRQSSVSVKE
jgi:hypothetical protein